MKKSVKITILIIAILLIGLETLRAITPREIDDIHPNWSCENEYIEKADILWVMPRLHNTPISENKEWCEEMRESNKTLGMHGVYHWYHEFNYYVNETELQEGIKIFRECFNQTPTMFKPPFLDISRENKKLIKKYNMTIRTPYHQTIHKVYHCQNKGRFPNWVHDIF